MSLLDDYDKLTNSAIENECMDYLNSIDKYDIPAFYQAWYDILKKQFLDLSNPHKVIYLNTLKDYFPWGLIQRYRRVSDNHTEYIFSITNHKYNDKCKSGVTELINQYIEVYSTSYDSLPSMDFVDTMDFMNTIDNLQTCITHTTTSAILKDYYTDINNIINCILLNYNINEGYAGIRDYLSAGNFRWTYNVFETEPFLNYTEIFLKPKTIIDSKYWDIKQYLERLINHRIEIQSIT